MAHGLWLWLSGSLAPELPGQGSYCVLRAACCAPRARSQMPPVCTPRGVRRGSMAARHPISAQPVPQCLDLGAFFPQCLLRIRMEQTGTGTGPKDQPKPAHRGRPTRCVKANTRGEYRPRPRSVLRQGGDFCFYELS
jgi:hypothetical protein